MLSTTPFSRLSKPKQHVSKWLFFLILFSSIAVPSFLSKFIPDTNAHMYGFLLAVICIFGNLFLFNSVQAVRMRYIVLFGAVLVSSTMYGVLRTTANY
ncbi:MAG: hypothetical protein JWM78_3460 [Verrucomicrobiaceae bacterium]|nr:hypothetical protein [Verrucomicrobiaceae bacterium]